MLQQQIEQLFDHPPAKYLPAHLALFQSFKGALNAGEVRAAEPDEKSSSGWRVNGWVKKGILLGFRMGAITDMSIDPLRQPFFDKSTYPAKHITSASGIRIVPGGSSIRDGCFIGKGVTCMPPMFINVGAYVGDQTMIDSHSLVGSCAQVGKSCHLSAAAQIGGVLEPVGAMPVIIEDEVLPDYDISTYAEYLALKSTDPTLFDAIGTKMVSELRQEDIDRWRVRVDEKQTKVNEPGVLRTRQSFFPVSGPRARADRRPEFEKPSALLAGSVDSI